MKHVSSLVPAAHLPPFSTGSALIRPELHIYLKNPPPLCCDAVLKGCFLFSPLFSLFFLQIYIFHKKPTCPGGLPAEILTKEKTCSFPSVSDIYPPQKKISQKSRCRSSLLINSSDGIGLGGLITFFCQHGGAVLQYLKPWDVKLLDANTHLSLSSSRFSSQGLVAAEDCLVPQEGKHSGGISLEQWKQSGEEG